MSDKAQRTEPATQRRLEKAREDGQFPAAREFVAALQFMVFVALMGSGGRRWFVELELTAHELWTVAFRSELTPLMVSHYAWVLFVRHVLPLLAAGLALAVATLVFRLATTQFGLSWKKLTPDFTRLNPLAKLRELPGQNLPAALQATFMLPLFLWAVYVIARDQLENFLRLPLQGVEAGARMISGTLLDLCWKAAGLFLIFGCVDLFRQIRKYQAELRMSKQEIKEEAKDSEGNPQMKAKVRRLQRDRARRQMMKEIPTATAVVVNPTHFAVAIRYQLDAMTAPLVVAKGKNYLALRIRQKAIEHQVPIIENPPLAQALYKSVDVGQEIPPHLYRAVAEILAYIFKLMNGRLPG